MTEDFDGEFDDLIIDSDRIGKITVDGVDIAGTGVGQSFHFSSLGAWETSDRAFRVWARDFDGGQSLGML